MDKPADKMRKGFELLKADKPYLADEMFRESESLSGAFASATIRCMLGQYAETNPCDEEKGHLVGLAKKGNIDALALTSMGSKGGNPFGFSDDDALWAEQELIRRGVGDRDRDSGIALLRQGDHSGAVLLQMAAERRDPVAQYELAQHLAVAHERLDESLFWLTAAHRNGVFIHFGLDSKAADREFLRRHDAFIGAMSDSVLESYKQQMATIDDQIGEEAQESPSPALMVVGQVAELLANPTAAVAHAQKQTAAERDIKEILADIDAHEDALHKWITSNASMPSNCTIGIAQMPSGSLADIGFADNCALEHEDESLIRSKLWDAEKPPLFVSKGDSPPYFTVTID